MKINKSLFTPEELKQYEALIAKARVPEESQNGGTVPPQEKKQEFTSAGQNSVETTEKPSETNGQNVKKEETNPAEPAQKSTIAPEIAYAMQRIEQLEKSIEMERCTELAKKYALIGEDTKKLATTLYNMRKSDLTNYNAYLSLLDKQLELTQKSGLFSEIGKSGHGGTGGSVLEKIETVASEIMKSDPSLSRVTAIAKAWDAHPELAAEYDEEYQNG